MRITLPVQLNPISRRKDRSVKLSFESRELDHAEILSLMSMEGEEGWLLFSSNELKNEDMELPKENAELEQKSMSKRQKAVIFLLWKQATDKGKYAGTFEQYYNQKMEAIINQLKEKLDD